jgi:hypothetical protein
MAEYTVTAELAEISQEERQRRLGHVYELLIDRAWRKRVAEQPQSGKPARATTADAPAAGRG